MKKRSVISMSLTMILAMILMAVLLTACKGGSKDSSAPKDLSDSKYVGTWKAADVSLGDKSGALEDEILLVVNGDGTGELKSTEETSAFTWEPVNGGFKTKGDARMTFKEDGADLVTKVIGAELRFKKSE